MFWRLRAIKEKLHDAVIDFVVRHMENDFADVVARKHTETVKGHGREDKRIYYFTILFNSLSD